MKQVINRSELILNQLHTIQNSIIASYLESNELLRQQEILIQSLQDSYIKQIVFYLKNKATDLKNKREQVERLLIEGEYQELAACLAKETSSSRAKYALYLGTNPKTKPDDHTDSKWFRAGLHVALEEYYKERVKPEGIWGILKYSEHARSFAKNVLKDDVPSLYIDQFFRQETDIRRVLQSIKDVKKGEIKGEALRIEIAKIVTYFISITDMLKQLKYQAIRSIEYSYSENKDKNRLFIWVNDCSKPLDFTGVKALQLYTLLEAARKAQDPEVAIEDLQDLKPRHIKNKKKIATSSKSDLFQKQLKATNVQIASRYYECGFIPEVNDLFCSNGGDYFVNTKFRHFLRKK